MPCWICVWVTEMPAEAAASSMTSNLISQLSTALGICADVSWISSAYGLAAACRFETWVSSDETVIRWSPTIAAAPILTGEHAASTAHAPRPMAPRAARRVLGFLSAQTSRLPNTGDPFPGVPDESRGDVIVYESESTERMTSAHHASNSVSRSGSPPKAPPETPVLGTGTSMVRTAGLSTVFGYSR